MTIRHFITVAENAVLYEYRNQQLMSHLISYLENAGLTFIGRGARAAVFRNKTGEVVKAFENDPCYVDFVNLVKKNPMNEHFPRIRKIAALQRSDLTGAFLVKMEPLTPMSEAEFNGNIGLHCYLFVEHNMFNYGNPALQIEMPRKVLQTLGGDPIKDSMALNRARLLAGQWEVANKLFAKALNLVMFGKVSKSCWIDLHSGNFMKRGGTWVITDPYYLPLR